MYADTAVVSRTHDGIVRDDHDAYGDRVVRLTNALGGQYSDESLVAGRVPDDALPE